jgi:predicted nucleotidyltransferase
VSHENTALGNEALYSNTTGANNIAAGFHAGINLTTGSNNIDIGNAGEAAESGVIRIGTAGTQSKTFVAGIEGSKIIGAAVYVTASGQLGVLASSERYKTAITPMGSISEKLQQLRPVSFHLKTDPQSAVQYGLIAEEVDKIYPELVIRDGQGKIQGVLHFVEQHRREFVIDVVAELAALEKPLRQRGLTLLALFGSVVRGAAHPDSDIDLLVDVTPDAQFSLIDLVAVKDFLEDQLGRKVDVVTRGGSNPAFGIVFLARLKPCSNGERPGDLCPSHSRGNHQYRDGYCGV